MRFGYSRKELGSQYIVIHYSLPSKCLEILMLTFTTNYAEWIEKAL